MLMNWQGQACGEVGMKTGDETKSGEVNIDKTSLGWTRRSREVTRLSYGPIRRSTVQVMLT